MTNLTPAPDLPDKRVIIVVLDGAGAGALPDAGVYGDEGAKTLFNVLSKHAPLDLPTLFRLGLGKILKLDQAVRSPQPDYSCFYGRMAPRSPGKDTTSGHWELAGVVVTKAFPVYPNGFPDDIIQAFKEAIGRGILGNYAVSGTEIIKDLGEKHLETGYPIVYTSADSVFQIACHDKVVPTELLYDWCKIARSILTGKHAVGRVIARPFTGEPGAFKRTSGRHDYSLSPPGETLLDRASGAGLPVAVIGKVSDVFAHRGITIHRPGGDNEAIAVDLKYLISNVKKGLIWATFGDFDTLYGHRNDSLGFARALESFDIHLAEIVDSLKPDDLLAITADHGCDPLFPTTDHTREYVPVMVWGQTLPRSVDLGIRPTFADLAASAAHWLGLKALDNGSSFI